jgi:pimeloyl-ACP methyl ester carboxylesterase
MFFTALTATSVLMLTPITDLPTVFWGISPEVKSSDIPALKKKNDKAVVFIHGLLPHVFHPERATQPEVHDWQVSSGLLAKQLADDYDIFGFSYAQSQSVDSITLCRGLRTGINAIEAAQYKEIVLIGHSAGAIIARQFAEFFPEDGITKIICISGPHLGSGWAKLPTFTLPKTQVAFINSLLPDVRTALHKERAIKLPKDLEACCVLSKWNRTDHDTIVNLRSQWPTDLQDQGIPAVLASCNHFDVMTNEAAVKSITELVRGKIVRWKPEQTELAQFKLFGTTK